MKTQFSLQDVERFLEGVEQAEPETVHQLVEGHSSQAFSFESGQDKYVLRVSESDAVFKADLFAFEHYGQVLPIPRVFDVGEFQGEAFYCVSEFKEGKTSNTLSDEELTRALTSIQDNLARTFMANISFSHGYGELDVSSGNATHESWRDHLLSIEEQGADSFKSHATNIGLSPSLIESFFNQYRTNLPFASEVRRPLHGDPAFDNMLIRDDSVVAVIDWEQTGYGDWMCDFARLDFWWPGRYGNKAEFAKKYNLEADHLDEREALYWAANALWTIEFADKAKSEETTRWLQVHLDNRIIH